MHIRMTSSLLYSQRFNPNVFGCGMCLSSLRACHFLIFFRVKNFDVMYVRSRCYGILLVCKVLYGFYMDQQGSIIIFNMMT